MFRKFIAALFLFGLLAVLAGCGGLVPNAKANKPLANTALLRLAAMGSTPGAAMMIRIFKESSELEVWKQTSSGKFELFNTYEICAWSGVLGPKIKEGDRQAPEGFYTISASNLNPNSGYYLAFNTGFPNKFDRAWNRTGSDLMVHGDCSSRGCYAMTDEQIAEIYALARESFKGGNQSFQLQIFPFRMTPQNLAREAASPHLNFWKNIKEGYDRFELTRRPPIWDVCNKEYVFDVTGPGGSPLSAAAACPVLSGDPTMLAMLAEKRALDESVFAHEVTSIAEDQAKATADAQAAAEEQAAIKARGEAVGGFLSGITGIFGGGKDEDVEKVIDPTLVAPVPMPTIQRG